MNHLYIELAIIFRTAGLIFSVSFVLRYLRLPWRSTVEGRHLMSFSTVVALFLLYATVNNIAAYFDSYVPPGHVDGDYFGRLPIAVLLYGWVAYEMWKRNHLLTLARRQAREYEHENASH